MGQGSSASGGARGAAAARSTRGAYVGSGGIAQGMVFVKPPNSSDYAVVMVSVAKLNASLKLDPKYYVGAGGTGEGAIAGRYAQAAAFLQNAKAAGTKVEMPKVYVDKGGFASISDGRHRFAALRDLGARTIPVAVPKGNARRFARLFGP